MSEEEAVPAIPAIPIAVSVSEFSSIAYDRDPNVDRNSPHFILQMRRDEEQDCRGRERTSPRNRDRRSRYESCSPPRDREVSAFLANPVRQDYIIGATLEDWQSAIADYREIEQREGTIYTSDQVIEQLLGRFTRLRIDNGGENDEEDTSKYVEAVFVNKSNTYHKIYTGKYGGKYFFDVNGQQKYIKPVDRVSIELIDPEGTPIVDTNPVLRTTDVVAR